jgi:hypothetical protein
MTGSRTFQLRRGAEMPILSITWRKIMDLIGRVGYIENRLGERMPDRRREKSRKQLHEAENAVPEEDADQYPDGHENGIGRVIDVSV